MAEMIMGEARGKELTDATEGQLTEDLVPEVEVEGGEPSTEPPEEDLPEGLTEPEADKDIPSAEPSGESDVDRLTRLGVYKPGLVETDEQWATSYKHAQDFISSTRRAPREDAPPPSTELINELADGLAHDDPKVRLQAVVQVVNAMSAGQQQKLDGIDNRLFAGSHADYSEYAADVEAAKAKYPGIATEDAYNMARGMYPDKLISKATLDATAAEKRRETDRQQALREKPGAGVRTGPVDIDGQLAALAARFRGEQLRYEMDKLLAKAGK